MARRSLNNPENRLKEADEFQHTNRRERYSNALGTMQTIAWRLPYMHYFFFFFASFSHHFHPHHHHTCWLGIAISFLFYYIMYVSKPFSHRNLCASMSASAHGQCTHSFFFLYRPFGVMRKWKLHAQTTHKERYFSHCVTPKKKKKEEDWLKNWEWICALLLNTVV